MRVQPGAAIIAVAAFVPLLVFGALQMAESLRQIRAEAEEQALIRARQVNQRIDAELAADKGALAVFATSRLLKEADVAAARERALAVMELRPAWRNVILTDIAARTEIWQTRAASSGPVPARPAIQEYLDGGNNKNGIGGITEGPPPDCPCIVLHELVGERVAAPLLLTVERSIADFQEIMMEAVEGSEVAYVVDRRSLFIARSLDYASRLGTLATQYVQEAVAKGGEGLYLGVTFEGQRNRTAYSTSELTGWSTHIAVLSLHFALLDIGSLGFTLLAGATSLLFAGGVTWFGWQDLRARRLAERAQLQTQKLEAVGRLAGGIAHDFNNLLTVVVACLRQLKKGSSEPQDIAAIEQGLAAAERGASLTRQLLSFARTKPFDTACVDLRATVEGVRDLLVKSLGPGVTLEIALAREAAFARTNAAQLELALLNLAVNARDAMPNGGRFAISSHSSRIGDFIEIIVRDTGIGMSEEIAARAMEPFFTTKPEGQGTGLGLAQVQALAAQSGGSLELDTAPGKGTAFVLRLPACVPASPAPE